MSLSISLIFWVLVLVVLFTTVAPLTGSVQWWIRGWDFPRLHIIGAAIVICLLGIAILKPSVIAAMLIMLSCAIYQGYRIYPYSPLVQTELTLATNAPQGQHISLIASNVLMENTRHDLVRDMIEREDPDILFLMEIDETWATALDPYLGRYSTVLRQPMDNHYGLIFATRLKTDKAETVFLSDDNTPTVIAELHGPGGKFQFVGLHPRPPVPGNDTADRDKQIKKAAQLADSTYLPVIAMGDFNDVAWSWTSERFKYHGKFRDPRIGRGILPSFDARSWWMRFPIDQLYLTEGLQLVSFARLAPIGSDHFPMKGVIVVDQD